MEMGAIKQAQASAVVSQFDEALWEQIEEIVYQRREVQLLARAEVKLRPEYEEKFQHRCERWEDEHAGFKRTLQDEFDAQREHDRVQDRRRIREEFAERLETAKEAQAEQRLAQADEQILMLIKTLLPADKKTFLHEYGFETIDVWSLNTHILHRHQLQMMHELTESTRRVVKVRTSQAEWQAATKFWLEAYEAPEEPKINGIPARFIVPRAVLGR
jgi:hypothetical protein